MGKRIVTSTQEAQADKVLRKIEEALAESEKLVKMLRDDQHYAWHQCKTVRMLLGHAQSRWWSMRRLANAADEVEGSPTVSTPDVDFAQDA